MSICAFTAQSWWVKSSRKIKFPDLNKGRWKDSLYQWTDVKTRRAFDYEQTSRWRGAASLGVLMATVVTTRGSAPGHFTQPLYEVVNLAPFVTTFSTRLMASWQLYSLHVLWVVMQRNYIGPNLMNQVSVSAAALTLLACDLLSLSAGQTEAFTLGRIQSHCSRNRRKSVITANQECADL